MNWKDLKYLAAYILPISAFYGLAHSGWVSFLPIIIAFIAIPLIEITLPKISKNLSENEAKFKNEQLFFDILLYLNIPIILALLYFYFTSIPSFVSISDWVGNTGSVALILASSGINVAHELGHKNSKLARIAAKTLLLPSLYMHFIIEHNLGHHLHVSTPLDPATSRKGENIYFFWVRSTLQSYISAWKIEKKVLNKRNLANWSPQNRMVQFTAIQFIYLLSIFLYFGVIGLLMGICMAVVSFLILETINYVEHYGLVRKKKANGKYEVVTNIHSWNSNHQVGRIILYELTRHSDHHYKSNKKYQVLDSHEGSPELPYGYPASLLLSLLPPLWFKIMNPKVEYWSSINS